jgi:hydroxymethylpyrimidine pyrophosphatase-like HAD family hydrolase
MMQIVLFTDIDDTLMQTQRKCPPYEVKNGLLRVGAVDRQGQALSYMTQRQQRLFELLRSEALVIPVTGRNLPALKRTCIGFEKSSYRITSHGAMITDHQDTRLPRWPCPSSYQIQQEQIQTILDKVTAFYNGSKQPVRCHLVKELGTPTYVSVKMARCTQHKDSFLELEHSLGQEWKNSGGRLHINGHNAAFLPPLADKAKAVSFLRERLEEQFGPCLFMGAGDSLSDQPFMAQCDFQLLPTGSQLEVAR